MLNDQKNEAKDFMKMRQQQGVSEKNSPRVPTMEEFLSKKKVSTSVTQQKKINRANESMPQGPEFGPLTISFMKACPSKFYQTLETNEWKQFQAKIKKSKRRNRKWLSKVDAAVIIQRAYRGYRRRKLVKMLNKEVKRKCRPHVPTFRPRGGRILDMFSPSKNSIAKVRINEISRTLLSPVRKQLLSDTSLFQKDRETVLVLGGIDIHSDYGTGKNTGRNIFRYVPDDNKWGICGRTARTETSSLCGAGQIHEKTRYAANPPS
ncbi:hypothetical protein NQ317_013590 [Molorchus minor]|uniref:Uncharacterized protein n=1 Tax=Molorchus minor TaxID=1323400 RepID=A0ABQ9IXU1_9CUCU|nr:hypothetical protein NQ317_013590 [Molorchus minor]